MMYTLISEFAIILLKKQVVKIRKTEADSDSDGGENHTCSRLQKKHSFVACYLSSVAQAKYIFLYIYFLVFWREISM